LADVEGRCPAFAGNLKASAARLEFGSKLYRLRTRIYRESTSLLLRAGIFTRILLIGGYIPNSSGTRLAPHQAMKDLFLGVTGIFKILNSAAQS
jgi:hypothetical protein